MSILTAWDAWKTGDRGLRFDALPETLQKGKSLP